MGLLLMLIMSLNIVLSLNTDLQKRTTKDYYLSFRREQKNINDKCENNFD